MESCKCRIIGKEGCCQTCNIKSSCERVCAWSYAAGCLVRKTFQELGESPRILSLTDEAIAEILQSQTWSDDKKSYVESAKAMAVSSGTPIEIHWQLVKCDGTKENCCHDRLTAYAMPDGSTQVELYHF